MTATIGQFDPRRADDGGVRIHFDEELLNY